MIDLPRPRIAEGWAEVLALRERALKALEEAKAAGVENPLDAQVVLPDPQRRLGEFEDLADMLGVSRVHLDAAADEVAVVDLRALPRCDRCWRRTPDASPRSDGGTLCDRCADAVGA
jgi:isoleucyl-tRNA synthetase